MDTWSIVSMLMFFFAFIGIVVYTFKLNKKHVDYMANIPLKENENINMKES